jgi:hypothetical protein
MEFTIHEIAFKLEDLLINILPEEVKIDDTTLDRTEWVWCLEHVYCRACTVHGCLPPHQLPEDLLSGLSALKQELKDQLSNNQARIDEIKKEFLPQTVAQVDELQKKLHAALVELDKRRVELERGQGR